MQNAKQKRMGFNVLFLTEIWERFGFYTVASLLILYMTKALNFSDSTAYTTFATFSALLYITPLIGGYLADKILGYRRTLLMGVITLAIGYVFLSFPSHQALYFGLALVIMGNGFFKSMPYALLGKIYEDQPEKLESKFTIYYLAINIGGIPALVLAGVIANLIGWNSAFAIAAVGLVIALTIFSAGQRYFHHLGNAIDHKKITLSIYLAIIVGTLASAGLTSYLLTHPSLANISIYLITAAGLLYIGIAMRSLTTVERKRLLACILMFAVGTAFFVFYYQAPTSLTLFIDRHVNHHIFGVTLPSSSYWGFNPAWIILLGPFLSAAYRKLGKHNPSTAIKFGIGIALMGIAYYVIAIGITFANKQAMTSSWWIIGSYGFQAVAELLVSALGNGLASQYAPKHLVGVMIGIWFLSTSIGGIIAGKIANIAAVSPHIKNASLSLHIYKHAFLTYGNIALIVGAIACALAPIINWLTNTKKCEPSLTVKTTA